MLSAKCGCVRESVTPSGTILRSLRQNELDWDCKVTLSNELAYYLCRTVHLCNICVRSNVASSMPNFKYELFISCIQCCGKVHGSSFKHLMLLSSTQKVLLGKKTAKLRMSESLDCG